MNSPRSGLRYLPLCWLRGHQWFTYDRQRACWRHSPAWTTEDAEQDFWLRMHLSPAVDRMVYGNEPPPIPVREG